MLINIEQDCKNDVRFLQIISGLSGIPSALWLTGRPLTEACWTSCADGEHPCFTHEPLRGSLEEFCRRGYPVVFFESDQVFYGIMSVGSFSLALGPASSTQPDPAFEQNYSRSHGMNGMISLPRKEVGLLTRYMELAYLHFTGTAVPPDRISISADGIRNWQSAGALEEYQLDQSEYDRSHRTGVDFENELLQAVKSGDTAVVKALFAGSAPDYAKIGDLSDEAGKEKEYLSVAAIALITRAAVAGGVPFETAHELGDVYLRRLGRAVIRKESFTGLMYSAVIEFAELVRKSREEKSGISHVDACREYIEKNLRKDLRIGDIAPAIGINRSHLSRLFRQAEGITIQQYLQKERCRHAAGMLQYSDYSISQIAQYFGFSSQSYFGTCFRQWYGMTPNEYRKGNH